MGAMPEEVEGIISMIENRSEVLIGDRLFHKGTINHRPVVVVFSKWGKVAAAITATILFNEFQITELIFTGVAGAIQESIGVGDVVIGKRFYQHDMDARPLLKQFEIPLLNLTYFESAARQIDATKIKLNDFFESTFFKDEIKNTLAKEFGNSHPRILVGDIASGDHFFSTLESKKSLHRALENIICVEMEGAAVAQVCFEFNKPFTIIRIISDALNESTTEHFKDFVNLIASKYSKAIISKLLA